MHEEVHRLRGVGGEDEGHQLGEGLGAVQAPDAEVGGGEGEGGPGGAAGSLLPSPLPPLHSVYEGEGGADEARADGLNVVLLKKKIEERSNIIQFRIFPPLAITV